jgi:hypothetical protein
MYSTGETERADAVFRDPDARKLAGDRGTQIAAAMPFARRHSSWLLDSIPDRTGCSFPLRFGDRDLSAG